MQVRLLRTGKIIVRGVGGWVYPLPARGAHTTHSQERARARTTPQPPALSLINFSKTYLPRAKEDGYGGGHHTPV